MGKFIITEEEKLRIQGLYPQLNKKSINEQSQSSHCTGNNTVGPPKIISVTQTKSTTGYKFMAFIYFGSTKSGTKSYEDLLTNLKSEVLKLATPQQKQGLSDGTLELSIVQITYARSSASNYLNGPLNPTNWNNGSKISGGYEGTVPNIKVPIKDSSHKDWKENEGYAKNRWSNFFNWAKKSGSKFGINFESNLSQVTPGIRITDTGGCTDEQRDIQKYKKPGQYLFISGVVKFKGKKVPEISTTELFECSEGLKIVVGFFSEDVKINSQVTMKKNSTTHKCDYATFDVYCNRIKVGTANMNNDNKRFTDEKAKVGLNQQNVVHVAPQKLGGTVYNTISVDRGLLKKVIANSKDGKITITMKGTPNTLTRRGKYHGDAPMVAAFTVSRNKKARLVYSSKEPYKSSKGSGNGPLDVSGSEYQLIATFNPCNNVKSN